MTYKPNLFNRNYIRSHYRNAMFGGISGGALTNAQAAALAAIKDVAVAGATAGSLADIVGLKSDAGSPTGSVNAKLTEILQGTPNVSVSWPAAAADVSVVFGAGGIAVPGVYVEVIPVNTIVSSIIKYAVVACGSITGNQDMLLEFATGLAGSEVLLHRARASFTFISAVGILPCVICPMDVFIPANTRVSVRGASNVNIGGRVGLITYPTPL